MGSPVDGCIDETRTFLSRKVCPPGLNFLNKILTHSHDIFFFLLLASVSHCFLQG